MDFNEAIDYIFEGNCVLFAGSGASLSAKNIKGQHLKLSSELTNLLYTMCELESDNSLTNAVDEYLNMFGEHSLITILKEEFTVNSIGEEHEILGSLNWKRIYTTNYDNVLETAYNKNSKILTPVTLNDDPRHYKDKKTLSIHLNGFINNLTPLTLNNQFKLTEVSYLASDFKDSNWGNLFRQDLVTSDAIFFVGFSLNYDLDLKRIIFATPELIEKCFFIVYEGEGVAALRNLKKFGTPIPIGIKAFSQQVKERQKSYIHVVHSVTKFLCFTRPEFTTVPPEIKDKDFYKLLVEGDITYSLLEYSLFYPKNYLYYIYRDKLESVLNSIKNGTKNIVVTSDLGNGKTLFIKGLSLLLKKEGYNVFEYNKFYASFYRELEEICTKTSKAVLIVESYSHHFDILEQVKNLRSDLILVVTERSIINDISSTKLEEGLDSEYYYADLNLLSDKEIDYLIFLLDEYGLWGEYTSYDIDRKRMFISSSDQCRRNMRILLVKLINSPNIINRFKEAISTIEKKKSYYEALSLILVSKVFNFTLDLDDLIYALDDEVLNKPTFQNNPVIREFINFDEGKIVVKSSILSEVILSNVVSSRGVVSTLIKVCTRLDKRRNDKNVRIILKELISFSNLQRILQKDESEYKYNILHFFEQVRNMQFCQRNPHYWLQYAIARLSEREYGLADSYFATAYSLAKNINWFDTYQIDNHFARHLIENEIYNGSQQTCMEQFIKAHRILSNPLSQNIKKHYPFRVAQKYYPFYQKYFKALSKQDKVVFIQSCEEMLQRIQTYLRNIEDYRKKRDVLQAKELLELILQEQASKK